MINYLGRQRTTNFVDLRPIAQLVNVPALQGCQRCPYCWYYEDGRTAAEYNRCSEANKCGLQSLLYALERNIRYSANHIDAKFTPTPLIRQRAVNEDKRYLQFFSADISGYQCNSLCQYYPKRISSDKSIAECSNTNGCGRDGSFFNLLELVRTELPSLPDFANATLTNTQLMTLDGNILDGLAVDSLSLNDNNYVIAHLSDGNDYNVVSMSQIHPTAWLVLAGYTSDASTWLFRYDVRYFDADYSRCLVILDGQTLLRQELQAIGMASVNWAQRYLYVGNVLLNNNTRVYFVYNTQLVSFVSHDGTYLVCLQPLNSSNRYAIRIGSNSAGTAWYYLSSPTRDYTPSSWKRQLHTTDLPDGVNYINITTPTSSMSQFLMDIGVRQSFFY